MSVTVLVLSRGLDRCALRSVVSEPLRIPGRFAPRWSASSILFHVRTQRPGVNFIFGLHRVNRSHFYQYHFPDVQMHAAMQSIQRILT